MAKGKQGFQLEAWKFGIYLAIPIAASWWFSDPARQKQAADYYQYVQYPANPNVSMKEQIELLQKQRVQQEVYREQLRALNQQANRTTANNTTVAARTKERIAASATQLATTDSKQSGEEVDKSNDNNGGWLRWIGLRR
jgi:hypothetical protein